MMWPFNNKSKISPLKVVELENDDLRRQLDYLRKELLQETVKVVVENSNDR